MLVPGRLLRNTYFIEGILLHYWEKSQFFPNRVSEDIDPENLPNHNVWLQMDPRKKEEWTNRRNPFFFVCLFVCFGCTHGMWKLLVWGSNPCHNCNQSHSSDNTGSLTSWATKEFPRNPFFYFSVFLLFLEPLPWHMEVPKLGVKSEL